MIPALENPVTYIRGIGPKKAELYSKLGIATGYDLLCHFPRDYIDFSQQYEIASAPIEEPCVVKARVVKKLSPAFIRKGMTIYKAVLTDDTADLTLMIYNNEYLFKSLVERKEYILYGKLSGNFLRREMSSPMIIPADTGDLIQPVYHLTDGLTQNALRMNIHSVLESIGGDIYEPLPKRIMEKYSLCSLDYAFENIHFPRDAHSLAVAKRRLVFEELMTLRLGMRLLKNRSITSTGCTMKQTDLAEYYSSLPFELTGCQQRAIAECCSDMCRSYPMNRLVQGDVGSGKTAVAAGAAFFAARNGYQTALMAPTEILASQHYETLKGFLEPLGIKVALLTGSLTPKNKAALKEQIKSGEYSVVVGTHALVQQTTEFARLGLVITDEQHRFGVGQRETLASKGENPHKLVMSATPIPRTLAMMIYGDLELSVLDELPKGRQKIETYAVTGKLRERALGFVRDRLDEGRQGYIVCPMIEENDMELKNATAYAENLANNEFCNYRIGLLHGKMPAAEKDKVMRRFKEQELDLLVSTTVVEVGVDVPNAVIMVVENADRFGLSQLHQLRGRVGRGSWQSYCILITDNVTEESRRRLKILSSTADGFKISEEDLKLRGPGDFFGSRQHGLPKMKIADMSSDTELLQLAQQAADEVIASDPTLDLPDNKGLRELADQLFEKGCDATA